MKEFNKKKLFIIFWTMISMIIFLMYYVKNQDHEIHNNRVNLYEIEDPSNIDQQVSNEKSGTLHKYNSSAGLKK